MKLPIWFKMHTDLIRSVRQPLGWGCGGEAEGTPEGATLPDRWELRALQCAMGQTGSQTRRTDVGSMLQPQTHGEGVWERAQTCLGREVPPLAQAGRYGSCAAVPAPESCAGL